MVTKPKYLIDSVSVEWFVTTFQILTNSVGTTLDELRREAAQQGIDLGQRSDMVSRLVDLGMARHDQGGYWLTARGKALQDTLARDKSLFLEYLHQWHYVRALLPGAREYFTSYRLMVGLYWENPLMEPAQALSEIVRGVTGAFPAALNKTGLSGASIGKGLVLWRAMCGGRVARRSDAPVQALLHALGLFGLSRGYRVGEPILLSDTTRLELCHYLLIEPSSLDPLIDRALRLSRKLDQKTSLQGRSILLLEPVITE